MEMIYTDMRERDIIIHIDDRADDMMIAVREDIKIH